MNPISVVLSNMPRLLRDIVVNALTAEPDIEIAGEAGSPEELRRLIEARPIDLVLASDRDVGLDATHRKLIEDRARLKLLVVVGGAGTASLHWMKPMTQYLGQLSPEGLVREIRSAVRPEVH